MKIIPIKLPIISVNSNLLDALKNHLPKIDENSVLAITSKVVSLSEGRVVNENTNKTELIKKESDFYINPRQDSPHPIFITIKNGILIPSAGIDESNTDAGFVLYPEDVFDSCYQIWQDLREFYKLDNFGVIITDSHTTPMRHGVIGIALSWCGFKPTRNYIGEKDIFQKQLRVTKVNVIDALATTAVFAMGEGNEQTPVAVMSEINNIEFTSFPPSQLDKDSIKIEIKDDLYEPLLCGATWCKGGGGVK